MALLCNRNSLSVDKLVWFSKKTYVRKYTWAKCFNKCFMFFEIYTLWNGLQDPDRFSYLTLLHDPPPLMTVSFKVFLMRMSFLGCCQQDCLMGYLFGHSPRDLWFWQPSRNENTFPRVEWTSFIHHWGNISLFCVTPSQVIMAWWQEKSVWSVRESEILWTSAWVPQQ